MRKPLFNKSKESKTSNVTVLRNKTSKPSGRRITLSCYRRSAPVFIRSATGIFIQIDFIVCKITVNHAHRLLEFSDTTF